MALGAMNGGFTSKNIKIVPVGLNYFNREKFRSEVIIEFGKPFTVPTEWAEEYQLNKKIIIEKLLNEIEARMKAVTLTANSYEELRTLHLLRKIYVPKSIRLSPTQYSELCKDFAKGIKKIYELEESKSLLVRVENYIREIDEIAVTDSEIRDTNFEQKKMKRKFLFSALIFFICFIFLFPGLVIMTPFVFYISNAAEKERILALQKNPNKVNAKDVVSSVKLIYFMKCLPFIYFLWICFFINYAFKFIYFVEIDDFISKFVYGSLLFPIYFFGKFV